jgi:DnaJ-class molecular chaperone
MSRLAICENCGGKGWRWTGAAREMCGHCDGSGHGRRSDQWRLGPMPRAPDPIKSRPR